MNRSDPVAQQIVANAQRLLEGHPKAVVARRARIERTKLYRFLRGQQMLRADELQRLAEALNVDVTAFYGRTNLPLDFQNAFLQADDFALQVSGWLLDAPQSYPVRDTGRLLALLADVEPEPEAVRLTTDLATVLRNPALSAFAFLGAWAVLWQQMTLREGIQLAKALRRIVPYHERLMALAATIRYRDDRQHIRALMDALADVHPHPLYERGVELLRYALAPERIDQCATLAHRILEKHRKRSRESVHRRLVTFKRTVDAPEAAVFWAKLLTYLDPNIPEPSH